MAQDHYYSDLNMHTNQLLQAVTENVGTLPSTELVSGRTVFLTTDSLFYFYDGTTWVKMAEVNLVGQYPMDTTFTSPNKWTIKINDAGALSKGSMSVAHWDKLEYLDDTEIPHVGGGSEEIIPVGTTVYGAINALDAWGYAHTGSGTPSSNNPHGEVKLSSKVADGPGIVAPGNNASWASEKQIVDYVIGLISTGNRPVVPFDPSTVSPPGGTEHLPLSYDSPEATGGAEDILTGDQFIITKAGLVGSGLVAVNPNDTLIANIDMIADSAATQTDANWTIIQAATVQSATEAIEGISRLARESDIDFIIANTDHVTQPGDKIRNLTPYSLQYYSSLWEGLHDATVQIGSTIATGVLNHGFNNINVLVNAYITGNGQQIQGEVKRDLNSVTVAFNNAPGAAWTITAMGQNLS